MEFSRSVSILWRRWYFFLPALLLALVVTAGVFISVKPTYSAETVLLLVPPNAQTNTTGKSSPFDSYGLNTVAAIVASAESSQSAESRLKADGVAGAYTVVPDPTGDTPEIQVTATAASPVLAKNWDAMISSDVVRYVRTFQRSSGASPATFVRT